MQKKMIHFITEVIENTLRKDGFTLKYQPFISLQGDTTEHYEALLHMAPDEAAKPSTTKKCSAYLAATMSWAKRLIAGQPSMLQKL
jgi:EAL domain-containing protein (putative c-di-GMP-specific phosphodiesterase class I)